jgi:hypothetical protein
VPTTIPGSSTVWSPELTLGGWVTSVAWTLTETAPLELLRPVKRRALVLDRLVYRGRFTSVMDLCIAHRHPRVSGRVQSRPETLPLDQGCRRDRGQHPAL